LDPSSFLPQGHYRQMGVVLNSRVSGERGKNVFLFLREYGPLWATVPGAAAGKSRLSGVSEPLVWGYFTLYRSPRRMYVKEVEVQEDFWALRRSGAKLSMALSLCRHVSRFSLPEHPQDELLPLLYWSMKALEGGTDPHATEFRFLFRWGSLLGVSPQLDRCASCGKRAEEGLLTAEGLTCAACFGNGPRQGGLSLEEMELNRLRKAVMLSGKDFRTELFGTDEDRLFRRASALLARILEGSV
jgi:DNA repair protein RecO (recombination protein O)